MRDETTAAAIRASAESRHLPQSHTEKWLDMPTPSRMALLDYAERLNLRTGQLVAAIDLLDEIEIREGIAPVAILTRDDMRRICTLNGSGPWRAKAFLDALRAIRFPHLKQTIDRIAAEVAALKLPSGVRVELPKDLGSDELTIRISARTASEVEKLIEAVAGKKLAIAKIADLLSGDDDAPGDG